MTDFLNSLAEAEVDAEQTRVAQAFMSMKGYPGIEALGVVELEDTAWYFYYELPEGILEVEVSRDAVTGEFERGVSTFITNRAEVRRLLGR